MPLLLGVISYLVGAIPFGYLMARAKGVDIFKQGSGNIGATNVGRVLGRKFGIAVFVLDFLKGALPVAIAKFLGHYQYAPQNSGLLEVVAGSAAFLGHLFPIYLGFRGGKGVATGAGVVAVMLPVPALAALLTWITFAVSTRYVSASSIAASMVLALVQFLLTPYPAYAEVRALFAVGAAIIVTLKHAGNVARLMKGTENKLQDSAMLFNVGKSLHVLALGLWFGSGIFFTFVVALSLFHTFETLGQSETRPTWFPQPEMFHSKTEVMNAPKEQGSRVAGAAVGPIFPWYFLLQAVCGFVALTTAWTWSRNSTCRIHRARFWLVALACVGVAIGWPIEHYVAEMRPARNDLTDAYLRSTSDTERAERLEPMKAARAEFGRGHGISLLLNFATLALVFAATALAGQLPERTVNDDPKTRDANQGSPS